MQTRSIGQLAALGETFCPLAAVNKWPYRHLRGDESRIVSEEFFAFGRFRSRGWSIYYIRTLLDTATKPLLLIPAKEVDDLFREIHNTLGIYCSFPDITRFPGFQTDFFDDESDRPRYLGQFNDDTSILDLEERIPSPGMAPEESLAVDDRSFPAFRRKMQAAILAGKERQKSAREKKRRERVNSKTGWCEQLKRTQRYLGVRPQGTARKEEFFSDPNQTYEQSRAAQEAYEIAAGLKLSKLDPTCPAPHPFYLDVVFVCVDIECYEKDHAKITEIGISTLDTADLVGLSPGEGGAEWMKLIRGRHFRIAEYAHLRNTEFVSGCADDFKEKFGISEWISIKEAPQVVASCFRHPFSAPGQYTRYPPEARMVGRYGCGSHYIPPVDEARPKRNVILVGHDIKCDIQYLRRIGYDVTNLSNVLEAIDTVNMYRAMKREQNASSLGTVLMEIGLTGWHLHNAGNDAGYTLEALVGISIAALDMKHAPMPDVERLDRAALEAQSRIIEEAEEWEMADEEGADGGEPVSLKSFDQAVKNDVKAQRYFPRGGYGKGRGGTNGGSQYGDRENSHNLKPSLPRRGEIKYHAANEAKLRDLSHQKDNATGNKPDFIPRHSKAPNQDMIDGDDDPNGGVPLPTTQAPSRLRSRLDDLDEHDADFFSI